MTAKKNSTVFVISYFIEDGEAGVSAVFKSRAKAEKRFEALVRGTFECDEDATPKDINRAVKKALKDSFFLYSGSGCGAQPWYDLTEEEVQ